MQINKLLEQVINYLKSLAIGKKYSSQKIELHSLALNPLVIIINIFLIKYITVSIIGCEAEPTFLEYEKLKEHHWYFDNNQQNLRLLAERDANERRAILEALLSFVNDIEEFCEENQILAIERGFMSSFLYQASQELFDKLILTHTDIRVRETFMFLWFNYKTYDNIILNHLIAIYISLIKNPANIDHAGLLINPKGNVDIDDYKESLNELLS